MPQSDLGAPLTDFLSSVQAARLTPSAKRLTKESMLNALNAFASGGKLVGGLDKDDISSVRAAFREQQEAVGATADEGAAGLCCCCCCCAAADTPAKIGPLRLSALSDVRQAFAMTIGPDDQAGGSCCCCCI